MNRGFGRKPNGTTRYRPRPGVYVIVDTGDGILATFQERPYPELQLPGGGVDPGESPLRALHREVLEETGYTIRSPRRLGMFHRFTFMPEYGFHAQKQCHIYTARLGLRRGAPSEDGHTAVFLPWDTAEEKLAVAGDRMYVRHFRTVRLRAQMSAAVSSSGLR
ncbi:MAG: NUDIX hydrolase [Pseudomonadota bacterium]